MEKDNSVDNNMRDNNADYETKRPSSKAINYNYKKCNLKNLHLSLRYYNCQKKNYVLRLMKKLNVNITTLIIFVLVQSERDKKPKKSSQ